MFVLPLAHYLISLFFISFATSTEHDVCISNCIIIFTPNAVLKCRIRLFWRFLLGQRLPFFPWHDNLEKDSKQQTKEIELFARLSRKLWRWLCDYRPSFFACC